MPHRVVAELSIEEAVKTQKLMDRKSDREQRGTSQTDSKAGQVRQ